MTPPVTPPTPTTGLNRLSSFLDSIGSFSEDMILHFNVNETLFHYTNLEGLLGILESNDVRLTNTRFCNDDAEMTHGLDLTRKVIATEREKADPKRIEYLDELGRHFDGAVDPVYISCFCEDKDKLSQWRGYAENGAGVTLEIEPAQFSYITGPDCPKDIGLMRFWKVF